MKNPNYKDKCGSCAKFIYCVMDGEVRAIGKCRGVKTEKINQASQPKCFEYVKGTHIRTSNKGRVAELNGLVERIITIRDMYDLSRSDRDALADACNIIYHNIELLAEVGTE